MRRDQLRVLLISTQFPFPPRSGYTMRVAQLARRLAARHDVTLLSYAEPGVSGEVERVGGDLDVEVVERDWGTVRSKRLTQIASAASLTPFLCRLIYTPALQQAIDALSARNSFDVVQLESSPLCAFRLPGGARVILDEHNIESEVFERIRQGESSVARRSFNRLEFRRFRRFERLSWTRVDGCAVTSEREERILREHAPETPVAVVPNGVDLDYFRPSNGRPVPMTAVFNGVLDYRPNLDGALYLVDEIWPAVLERCPDARLEIVGRGGPAERERLARPGVTVTGEVPDVRPHLAGAAVVVVPIRVGGGTRLKVVEGLAMGKPMVSTSLGCEGVNVTHGEELLVADPASAFADSIVRLFEDPSAAAALGAAGRARMEREYSWDLAAARLDELYERVVGHP